MPGAGGTQRLPRLVGPARAKDIIYSGRFVAAQEAKEIGFVDEVFPSEEVYAKAIEAARRYAGGPTAALPGAQVAGNWGDWRVFPRRPTFRQETEASFRSSLADPEAVLLIVLDGDQVVGGAQGHVHRPSSFSDELAVELSSVVVRPSHRNRGIARTLVGAV